MSFMAVPAVIHLQMDCPIVVCSFSFASARQFPVLALVRLIDDADKVTSFKGCAITEFPP